jgi:hypothetical protein
MSLRHRLLDYLRPRLADGPGDIAPSGHCRHDREMIGEYGKGP